MQRKKSKDEIIERALAGGLVGTALGALLTGKSEDTITAALVGAAIGASVKALKEAKEYNMPVMIEENGILFQLNPDGSKIQIRKLRISTKRIPQVFSI
jgi:hypothetical protein